MDTEDFVFADLPSGPTCRRFAFATDDTFNIAEQEKRRRAVVKHVSGWRDLVDVCDEWQDGNRRWIVVETPAPVTVRSAEQLASECPRYVAGTFAVDRSR